MLFKHEKTCGRCRVSLLTLRVMTQTLCMTSCFTRALRQADLTCAPQMGLHVFFGCYHNLFRLMAKCGVLDNLLVKEHTHTFVNEGDILPLS